MLLVGYWDWGLAIGYPSYSGPDWCRSVGQSCNVVAAGNLQPTVYWCGMPHLANTPMCCCCCIDVAAGMCCCCLSPVT